MNKESKPSQPEFHDDASPAAVAEILVSSMSDLRGFSMGPTGTAIGVGQPPAIDGETPPPPDISPERGAHIQKMIELLDSSRASSSRRTPFAAPIAAEAAPAPLATARRNETIPFGEAPIAGEAAPAPLATARRNETLPFEAPTRRNETLPFGAPIAGEPAPAPLATARRNETIPFGAPLGEAPTPVPPATARRSPAPPTAAARPDSPGAFSSRRNSEAPVARAASPAPSLEARPQKEACPEVPIDYAPDDDTVSVRRLDRRLLVLGGVLSALLLLLIAFVAVRFFVPEERPAVRPSAPVPSLSPVRLTAPPSSFQEPAAVPAATAVETRRTPETSGAPSPRAPLAPSPRAPSRGATAAPIAAPTVVPSASASPAVVSETPTASASVLTPQPPPQHVDDRFNGTQ